MKTYEKGASGLSGEWNIEKVKRVYFMYVNYEGDATVFQSVGC